MIHYLIELAIWMLLAYFIGCLLGWGLRNLKGAAPAVDSPTNTVMPAPVQAPLTVLEPIMMAPAPVMPPVPVILAPAVPEPVAAPLISPPITMEPAPVGTSAPSKMDRPRGIDKPRGGKPDDLQRISGIGPKNEAILHNLGFFHFDQIGAWTTAQVAWVDDHLRFNGRIGREEWIKQAGLLAQGKEAEFTKLYGTGGVKNAKGETLSGSRTRK